MSPRLVIIGAGLSGLAAALTLKRLGFKDYILLEKASEPGGLCRTHEQDGYFFDYAGHFLHLNTPWVISLIRKLLGDNLATCSRDSRIYINGHKCFYPFQNNLHGMPQVIIKECIEGFRKARISYGLPRPANQYGSFGEWIDQTLGAGIGRHFMHPYNTKLWTCSPYEMTTEWMKSYVPQTTEEDIHRGAEAGHAEQQGYNASFFYPQKGGIGALVTAMAERVSEHIKYNASVIGIDAGQQRLWTETEHFSYTHAFFTAPLPYMASICTDLPDTVNRAAAQLRAADILCVNVGLRKKISWPHSWVYFPEDMPIFFRMGASSNVMPSMAPEGKSSLYLEISHQGGNVQEMTKKALDDLARLRIVENINDVELVWPINIPKGYVIYDRHHATASRMVSEYLSSHSLYGIGRYARWEYGDMEDSFLQSSELINRLILISVSNAP